MLSTLFSRQIVSMIFLVLVLLISLGVSSIYKINGIHENMDNLSESPESVLSAENVVPVVEEKKDVKPDESIEVDEQKEGFEPLSAKLTAKEL